MTLWKEQTCHATSSYSKTRWWSRWEVYYQVLQQFGDVDQFLKQHDDIGQNARSKLLDIVIDHQKVILLKIELYMIWRVMVF